MRTPSGTECRYYYEDFHRGRELQECRLIAANPESLPWRSELCGGCKVPAVLRANGSPYLKLRLAVRKHLLLRTRLELSAECLAHACSIEDPYRGCSECARDMLGSQANPG